MIYVCEYDHSIHSDILNTYAERLPIPGYDGPLEGIKWEKRRERILAWLLFQNAVGMGKMKELNIRRTDLGKPYSMADPEFYFSISHCEAACACVISKDPCGIDIEKRFEPRENLIRKICHPDEYAVLDELVSHEREQQVRFLWSMKESFVKMDGRGLGYGMDSVNFSSILPVKSGEIYRKNGVSYFSEELKSYTLAVCVQGSMEIPVHVMTETELIRNVQR